MWPTDSARAISERSLPPWRARKAEVRDATRMPGIATSAFMTSSAMPSQRYSWSFEGLMSENGSTAIATPSRASVADSPAISRPRLAQPLQKIADELRVEPFLQELLARFGEVGLPGEQIAQRVARGVELSELSVGRGQDRALPEMLGQVRLHDLVHRGLVAAETILVDAEDELVPPGMVGVDIHRPAQERQASVPSPGEGDEEDGLIAAVERIQCDRALGGAQTGGGLLPEEEHDGESLLRESDSSGRGPRRAGRP